MYASNVDVINMWVKCKIQPLLYVRQGQAEIYPMNWTFDFHWVTSMSRLISAYCGITGVVVTVLMQFASLPQVWSDALTIKKRNYLIIYCMFRVSFLLFFFFFLRAVCTLTKTNFCVCSKLK